MAFRMTEEEFAAFCAQKTALHIENQTRRTSSNLKPPKKKRPPKYRNRRVYVYGGGVAVYEKDDRLGALMASYDSEKEYQRHQELKLLESAGKIQDLRWQVKLPIQEAFENHGEKVNAINYVADFIYVREGQTVVEDVKGLDSTTKKHITTKEFNLKWKLLKFRYPDYLFEIH